MVLELTDFMYWSGRSLAEEYFMPHRIHLMKSLTELFFMADWNRLSQPRNGIETAELIEKLVSSIEEKYGHEESYRPKYITSFGQESNHPFFQLYSGEIEFVKTGMNIPSVTEAYKNTKVSFGFISRIAPKLKSVSNTRNQVE